MNSLSNTEFRAWEGAELRADTESKKKVLRGRLIPYGVWAQIGTRFEERHRPGVFKKSTQERARRLPLMVSHEHSKLPIGSADAWDDLEDDGLWGTWAVAETREAQEVYDLAQDGHVSGLSAGFLPVQSLWEFRDAPLLDRVERVEAKLMEASVVALPTWDDARLVLTREGRVRGTPRLDRWSQWLDEAKKHGPPSAPAAVIHPSHLTKEMQ